ncbi:MAG: chloride channel protein [Muribaculaceae bacterium]|nr:chloride channel protein [Muribaculaceae bacterium]
MDTPSSQNRYARFIEWRELHITDTGFILVLALVTGILSGVGAWLLKLLIATITRLTRDSIDSINADWLIIIVPVIGITLTALFSRYILHDHVDNGVARMVNDLKAKKYKLSARVIYGSLIGSALTLGTGGTAGSEGPIAYTGAGIGSKLGELFRVNQRMMMVLLGCGAAAGIAGIFKAPIGGALFALEVLRIEFTTVAVLGIFLATLAASLVAYVLSGCTLDINVISPGPYDVHTVAWCVPLGIVCGLYSLYYTGTGGLMKKWLSSERHAWLKWLTSGLAIGTIIYLFPALYGEGYGTITDIINGNFSAPDSHDILRHWSGDAWMLPATCIGILLLKGAGSSATNNGGGVAGDFAPTLFAGCILGLFFAVMIKITGWADLSPAHYALIAMAGSMAGIIRAPLMAIFLTTEMVGGVEFLLPATIVALISYSIVMICKRNTFYHSQPFISSDPQ